MNLRRFALVAVLLLLVAVGIWAATKGTGDRVEDAAVRAFRHYTDNFPSGYLGEPHVQTRRGRRITVCAVLEPLGRPDTNLCTEVVVPPDSERGRVVGGYRFVEPDDSSDSRPLPINCFGHAVACR